MRVGLTSVNLEQSSSVDQLLLQRLSLELEIMLSEPSDREAMHRFQESLYSTDPSGMLLALLEGVTGHQYARVDAEVNDAQYEPGTTHVAPSGVRALDIG